MADAGPQGVELKTWTASWDQSPDDILNFSLLTFKNAVLISINDQNNVLDSLALAVANQGSSGNHINTAPPATELLSKANTDANSQRLAQKIAQKTGFPTFVAFNLVKNDQHLRLFAEKEALAAVLKLFPTDQSHTTVPSIHTSKVALPIEGDSWRFKHKPEAGRGERKHEVFDSITRLGERASEELVAVASHAITERGYFSVALSGGSIPAILSPALIAAADIAHFERWHVFLADERFVPEDHIDSSLKAWKEKLFNFVGICQENVHSINTKLSLEEAANAYEQCLGRVLVDLGGDGSGARLDAIVLGMGPDGHTASLFPGHVLLEENSRGVAFLSDSPKPPPERISLTFPAINAARSVFFVVTGASKATAVANAFLTDPEEEVIPAGRVLAAERTVWFLDMPAAETLLAREKNASHLFS